MSINSWIDCARRDCLEITEAISKDDVKAEIEGRKSNDHNIDSRVFSAVDKAVELRHLDILNKEQFLSLIWHERDESRLLTPKGCSRTLHDVSNRMIEKELSFKKLTKNLGYNSSLHKPEWFKVCSDIENSFNYSELGFIMLVLSNETEKGQSPRGSFYIYDGAHKSLVLAYLVECGEREYKSVEGILILPRPCNCQNNQ